VAVLQRLLARRPEDRYQTPAELAGVLTALIPEGLPDPVPVPLPAAPAVPLPEVETVAADTAEMAGVGPPPSFDDYRPSRVPAGLWLWLAVVGGGTFLLLALLFLAWVGQRGSTPPH